MNVPAARGTDAPQSASLSGARRHPAVDADQVRQDTKQAGPRGLPVYAAYRGLLSFGHVIPARRWS